MPTLENNPATLCPTTGIVCPFLVDCVTSEKEARDRIANLEGVYIDTTMGFAETAASQSIMDEQSVNPLRRESMDTDALKEADAATKKLGALFTGLEKAHSRSDELRARSIGLNTELADLNKQLAQDAANTCTGGPVLAKKWGIIGSKVLKCASPKAY
ncbi:MAG: hypothetical protein JWO47_382 [Candidatus Saccharibacteria bacterium]|nr:hypothetical protein [Candidatus Saccharibacteria bacterium]